MQKYIMSDQETDLYWEAQEEIYQDYCTLLDGTSFEVGQDALEKMKLNPEVDPKTLTRCEKYLSEYVIIGEDVVLEDEDAEAYAKERETQRAESRNAPSEGFEPM
jgi:hypothetical protein